MTKDYSGFLRNVPLFAELPGSDLAQICSQVHEVRLSAGEILFHQGSVGEHVFVIVEGKIEIFKVVNQQTVQLAIRQPGEVIGELSLLDSTPRKASAAALTDVLAIAIEREHIDQLLLNNPAAARVMLNTVITRLQSTEANLHQSEKMAQLGVFTAGIAHEMNNPSAAVQRGVNQLKTSLDEYIQTNSQLSAWLDNHPQTAVFTMLREEIKQRVEQGIHLDAGTRIDRENTVETWLNEMGFENGWEVSARLVALGYDVPTLEATAARFPPDSLPLVIKWMAVEYETQQLFNEIHHGAERISEIVKALKSYSYLDQAPNQDINIHEGLENTLVILRHKLHPGIEIVRAYDRTIPPIPAYGSELNQVWTNLIDNAIDAVNDGGRILLKTGYQDDWVIVTIEDNGPGIPPEDQQKLFYPFFTTKPVGKGTGLGLNISYRIVQKHGGQIEVFSQPGHTKIEVRLPTGANSWQR